jgi:hypothetical protein
MLSLHLFLDGLLIGFVVGVNFALLCAASYLRHAAYMRIFRIFKEHEDQQCKMRKPP